ncbi:MAG: hypothetical protein JXQ69_06765 [Paludibacteraceae bacterium]|nr:hypothetical protein [Paludibacteraceae bacterium]MBN2788007.1 hypothetical protein [Paludibacteraceae bacterium]
MTKIKTDIDTLFKQELAKGRAPVSDKSLAVFKKRLKRKSFFLFSVTNLNIYYCMVGIALIGGGILYGLNCNRKPINTSTPVIQKETKSMLKDTQQESTQPIETNTSIAPCTTKKKLIEDVVSIPKKEQATASSVNLIPKIDINQKETTEKPGSSDLPQKEVSASLKQQSVSTKPEAVNPAPVKEIRKIDTLYANDTIKTVKKKVRLKWRK